MLSRRLLIPILRILAVAVPLIVLGLLLVTFRTPSTELSPDRREANSRTTRLVREDRPAPQFDLPTVEGDRRINLATLSEKVALLDFWASWCPSCRKEAPRMQALWQRYEPQGVQFLGVNVNDTRDGAVAFEKEFGITFPSVFDPKGEMAVSYAVSGIPTFVVIGRDGRMVYRLFGEMGLTDLPRALDEVLRSR
ncbi:MAG: TlpA family protein disulfide reductase [Candidatus Methylomirabilales bacterium]